MSMIALPVWNGKLKCTGQSLISLLGSHVVNYRTVNSRFPSGVKYHCIGQLAASKETKFRLRDYVWPRSNLYPPYFVWACQRHHQSLVICVWSLLVGTAHKSVLEGRSDSLNHKELQFLTNYCAEYRLFDIPQLQSQVEIQFPVIQSQTGGVYLSWML